MWWEVTWWEELLDCSLNNPSFLQQVHNQFCVMYEVAKAVLVAVLKFLAIS